MNFKEISIDGFGVLSGLSLGELEGGLNVIHGANGSGKTTILHFLRGILCGFGDARRLRLLPPLKGGAAGGSVTVRYESADCEVTRRARPDHSDTLAFQVKNGEPASAEPLRQQILSLDADLVQTVFAVGGAESQAIEGMVRLALRDGIELRTRREETHWLTGKIEEIQSERSDLFNGEPARGTVAELEQRSGELARAISASQHEQARQQDEWLASVLAVRGEIARLEEERNWIDAELQAVECDLSEIDGRLWSPREMVIREDEPAARPSGRPGAAWVQELAELDSEIARARQVLRDLAGSRMKLSLAKAGLTGSEPADPAALFARQRESISSIERDLARLGGGGVPGLREGSHPSSDQQTGETVSRFPPPDLSLCPNGEVPHPLESIRQQIALMCQELGRQQAAHEHFLVHSERDGVDRCELELTRQIQRLRLRRDELVHAARRSAPERLRSRTPDEAAHCRCERHDRLLSPSPSPDAEGARRFAPPPRPDDAPRRSSLAGRRRDLQQNLAAARQKLQSARTELDDLERRPQEFASDRSVQEMRHEYAANEQRLADAREQWQSLAALQMVLQATRQRLATETVPPVMEEASALLKQITEGRYEGFRFCEERNELRAVTVDGADLPLHALSRGTLDQAALAFRLALWNEYRRRGVLLPLILDDVLADSDEGRLRAAATLLAGFGERAQQILFFTCQERLANLLESLEVPVRDLPGSKRMRKRHPLPESPAAPRPSVSTSDEGGTERGGAGGMSPLREESETDRVQPDDPYWLQTGSPASYVPSLGEQMARRLGALGVRFVADLVELDPELADIPLDSLQISAATLRSWQAEARLLVCVPDLTGRDAQLLVGCGILSPAELAEAEVTDLCRRIERLRMHSAGNLAMSWLSERPGWPTTEAVEGWVRRGRAARSYRHARDWSARRRNHMRHRTLHRNRIASAGPAAAAGIRVRLHDAHEPGPAAPHGDFYLHPESPVVEAPAVGPRTAERLGKIGVVTVSDLVNRAAEEIASRLNRRRISSETVRGWQQQAHLMLRIPRLRGHESQVLVACGITDPARIAAFSPEELFAVVAPFAASREGRSLLRAASPPDLGDVTGWVECARSALAARAA